LEFVNEFLCDGAVNEFSSASPATLFVEQILGESEITFAGSTTQPFKHFLPDSVKRGASGAACIVPLGNTDSGQVFLYDR
jgi:hypothetical protein